MRGGGGMDRKLWIEAEPRTLSTLQLRGAREAALHVVTTRSVEEAASIFTEGLEPVVACASYRGARRIWKDDQEEITIHNDTEVATARFF